MYTLPEVVSTSTEAPTTAAISRLKARIDAISDILLSPRKVIYAIGRFHLSRFKTLPIEGAAISCHLRMTYEQVTSRRVVRRSGKLMTVSEIHFSRQYLREEALPTPFCAGCGNGIITNVFLKAVSDLGYENLDKFAFVSGIGCGAWICSPHFNADTLHTTHGRAIAFATGLKLANPELNVVVISGDGDLAAIGGNHLIHAARRNIDLTVICSNNMIYGMTGGQVGPTTFTGDHTTTSPYGNPERPFDLARLVAAAGANYSARWTTAHPFPAVRSIKTALQRKGFTFVEMLSQCPTAYGRRARSGDPVELLKWFKSLPVRKKDNSIEFKVPTPETIDLGIFADREAPTWSESMAGIYSEIEEC
jgi:2-oxoglutarate ferredoxin oxidoreductase subunit beta